MAEPADPAEAAKASAPRPAVRFGVVVVAAAGVVIADQASKTWAENHLATRTIHLFWTFRLNLSYNTGAAFGLGRGYGPYIMLVGVAVMIGFFALARDLLVRSLLLTVALGLVLGGAMGNVADRVFRNNDGAVIDFIDPQWYPVFNVADAGISVGGVLLVVGGRKAS